MKVKIVNQSKHGYPEYATEASAGMDLKANIEIPIGFEAQIRPRSGLAVRNGVTVLNSPGTIDADYRGEVCIILINLSEEDFVIKDGKRICQMIIAKHEKDEWVGVEKLNETNRGDGGFGHTGR